MYALFEAYIDLLHAHKKKSSLNLFKSNQIWILITLFRLKSVWYQLNRKPITIQIWFNSTRFRIYFSVSNDLKCCKSQQNNYILNCNVNFGCPVSRFPHSSVHSVTIKGDSLLAWEGPK